jgi:cytochrome c oxidase subunit 2
MDRIEFVFWFATVICIGIFALVMAVIIYSVMTFRAPPEDESDGPSIHGHTGLEVVWTVVPAVLVVAIGVLSAVVLSQNGNAGTDPLEVKVFAQQFAWRFEYPQQDKLKSGELVLPLGRSVEFDMTSADVIHSFWIPEMGQKQDLVPGIQTKIVVTPKRMGTFTLVCTELCGLGHATMRAPVRVLSQADFAAWVKEQQSGGCGVHSRRLRQLSHVLGGGLERQDRPLARQSRGSGEAGGPAACRLHARVDRQPRQGDRQRLFRRRHAEQLRRLVLREGDRRARAVPDRGGTVTSSQGAKR